MRSTHHVAKTAAGAFVVAILLDPMLSAQNTDIQWTRNLKLSATDKREIVALAKLMGVEVPARVDANFRDDCCRIAWVTGRAVENGPERRWTEAAMIRDSWREYADTLPHYADRLRVGRWIADGPAKVLAGWRVRDGSWFVDGGVDYARPTVPYRAAELIVLALRHGTVVNKLPEETDPRRSRPSLPTLKRGRRYVIRPDPWQVNSSSDEYEIMIDTDSDSGGIALSLRIVGDTVQAVSLGHYEY